MGSFVIKVGGFVPFTTIDYPGALAAVVFCQGCPWRCGYCHNSHLQPTSSAGSFSWEKTLSLIAERKGFLDAVVFSGGEPLMQKELGVAIIQVKELGLKVGLHTAGIYPHRLKEILPLIDWVGMDIKAPFSSYEKVTHIPKSGRAAQISAEMIVASKIDYEFRTTVHPSLLSIEDLRSIAFCLKYMNATSLVLQPFRPKNPREWLFSSDFDRMFQLCKESISTIMQQLP